MGRKGQKRLDRKRKGITVRKRTQFKKDHSFFGVHRGKFDTGHAPAEWIRLDKDRFDKVTRRGCLGEPFIPSIHNQPDIACNVRLLRPIQPAPSQDVQTPSEACSYNENYIINTKKNDGNAEQGEL